MYRCTVDPECGGRETRGLLVDPGNMPSYSGYWMFHVTNGRARLPTAVGAVSECSDSRYAKEDLVISRSLCSSITALFIHCRLACGQHTQQCASGINAHYPPRLAGRQLLRIPSTEFRFISKSTLLGHSEFILRLPASSSSFRFSGVVSDSLIFFRLSYIYPAISNSMSKHSPISELPEELMDMIVCELSVQPNTLLLGLLGRKTSNRIAHSTTDILQSRARHPHHPPNPRTAPSALHRGYRCLLQTIRCSSPGTQRCFQLEPAADICQL
ncbi:hypothetical protein BC629DRAFT_684 [Irpex lacteus]|nr:hypothetical protein BC629DRAFT_684 [Irpex lacteus]